MKRRSHFRRIRRPEHSSLHELNITPLLDLVFVLLVIFIITTPQLSNSLEINLPSGKPIPPSPNAPKPKLNRLTVDDKGQIFLNDAALTLVQLKTALDQMKRAGPELYVVVDCAEDVVYQHMISVLDILQQLDITKVGLATQPAAKAL